MGFDLERPAERPDSTPSLDSRLLTKLDAAFEAAAATAAHALDAAPADADIGDRFAAALTAVLEQAAAHQDLTRLCLVEAPGLGASAVASKEAGLQRFVELLDGELARAHGEVPGLVAEMVVGGVYEVVQRAARAGELTALPELADELRRLWLPALRGK